MDILLIRHAQPEWDRDQVSRVDPGLTRRGTEQAGLLAERMLHERVDLLLVSTARRAQETAAPLRARLSGIPTEDRAWLHEINMPAHWDGTPADEVNRALSDARQRSRDLWWDGMPGGESFRDFHARVTIGLTAELAALGIVERDDRLWTVPPDAPEVTMVAHAGTNSVILGHLLGLDPEPWEWERFASDHASVTRLRTTPIAGGHIFSLQGFSDASHLPGALVTA